MFNFRGVGGVGVERVGGRMGGRGERLEEGYEQKWLRSMRKMSGLLSPSLFFLSHLSESRLWKITLTSIITILMHVISYEFNIINILVLCLETFHGGVLWIMVYFMPAPCLLCLKITGRYLNLPAWDVATCCFMCWGRSTHMLSLW